MSDKASRTPAIANPKPRQRTVRPIPQSLSAPEAPMPETVRAPKAQTSPKPKSKPKRKQTTTSPKESKPTKAGSVKSADISKSFAVTLNVPAELFMKMTKDADQYHVDRQTFLKMLLKKEVVAFREELGTLNLKALTAQPTRGPSENIQYPMRLTVGQYEQIKSALDPMDLRSMSANIADALLRYLATKFT